MLSIRNLDAGYGDLKVLHDVSIEVNEGEVVAIVGSNGAGKTTLMRVISGMVRPLSGSVTWFNRDLAALPAYKRPSLGIAHIPQGRGILGTLTVEENLLLGGYNGRDKQAFQKRLEEVHQMFPRLKERMRQVAGSLSGGEQQMLAIGRSLLMEPKLLILDEPSLGLAPIVVDEVFRAIERVSRAGVAIVIVEQNLYKALGASHRGYVLEAGRVALNGKASALLENDEVRRAYLGV